MPEVRRNLDFCFRLVRLNLESTLALRGAFLLQAGFMLVNNLIFFSVWLIFFRKFPELRGWRIQEVGALYGLVAGAFGGAMLLGGGVRFLAKRIFDGDLDTFLAQPKPALLHAIGSHSFASGWGDVVSGIALLAYSGYLSGGNALLFLLLLVGSTLLFLASGVLINSLAFWLGDTDALGRQLLEYLVTFSVYPQVIFSGYLKVILFTLIPAGFIGYLPVELLRNFTWSQAGAYLGGVVAYSALALWVFAHGLRRYESGNRFGIRA